MRLKCWRQPAADTRALSFGKMSTALYLLKIRAGYNSKAPAAVLRVHCIFGKGGVREWGAEPDKYYYILQILRIESIENWKGGNV